MLNERMNYGCFINVLFYSATYLGIDFTKKVVKKKYNVFIVLGQQIS